MLNFRKFGSVKTGRHLTMSYSAEKGPVSVDLSDYDGRVIKFGDVWLKMPNLNVSGWSPHCQIELYPKALMTSTAVQKFDRDWREALDMFNKIEERLKLPEVIRAAHKRKLHAMIGSESYKKLTKSDGT
jgi:hypothetical protein